MISLNYAKKIGDKYILNFYADTEDDISKFDPESAFMFYGKPSVGSIISCTNKNKDANYYLNDSGTFVKIQEGEPVPVELIAFTSGQKISGIQFNPSVESENILKQAMDERVHRKYYGVNSEGIVQTEEDTVTYVDTLYSGWNGVLVGKSDNGIMSQISLNDTINSFIFNTKLTTQEVISILSGLTYSYGVCSLVNDGKIRVYQQSDGKDGYDYFITVSQDDGKTIGFACVFATNSTFNYSNKEDPIEIGKTGWIDEYTIDSKSESGYIYCDNNANKLMAAAEYNNNTGKYNYILYYSDDKEKPPVVIYASDDSEDTGAYSKGWQNLSQNGVFELLYNEIVVDISSNPKYGTYYSELNGIIAGAVVTDAVQYDVAFSITNGSAFSLFGNNKILENGELKYFIEPSVGYDYPNQISASNAEYSQIIDEKTGLAYIYNATGNVVVSGVCHEVYSISTSVLNGTYSGDNSITGETGTASVYLTPNAEYSLPDNIIVTNASYNYDKSKGLITLYNATGNVTISAECVSVSTTLYAFDVGDTFNAIVVNPSGVDVDTFATSLESMTDGRVLEYSVSGVEFTKPWSIVKVGTSGGSSTMLTIPLIVDQNGSSSKNTEALIVFASSDCNHQYIDGNGTTTVALTKGWNVIASGDGMDGTATSRKFSSADTFIIQGKRIETVTSVSPNISAINGLAIGRATV